MVQLQIDVLNALRAERFLASFPIAKTDGSFVLLWHGKRVVFYDFLHGACPKATPHVVKELGKVLSLVRWLFVFVRSLHVLFVFCFCVSVGFCV